MDTNNNIGSVHSITNLDNVEIINFINDENQQDTLDVSNIISNQATAENINLYLKVNADGVYLDNSGSGKFSVDNQIARFDNTVALHSMVAVQVADASIINFDWTETSHILVENLDDGTKNTITGTEGNDSLQGTNANDTLHGSWGNDTLAGQAGADTYIGGSGDDVYVLSDDGEVDKIDFVATDTEKDSLDVSNIVPEGVTSENIAQYIQVTEQGVFLDSTGQSNFTADNLIAEFTATSVFNQDAINIILSGETILLDIVAHSGVQLDEGESFASEQELVSKLDTHTNADNSDIGVIRSAAGEKFNLNLQDHNITEAHGGAGDEKLDASNVTTNIGDGNLSSADSVKLYGREGSDTLVGSADSNFLDGGAGNDRIEAGAGRNLLAGGEGNDEFVLMLEDNSAELKADNLYDFSSQEGHRDVINLEQVLPSEANATNIHSYVKVTNTGIFIDVTGKAHFSDDNQLARFGEKASIDNLINLRLADGELIQLNRDNELKTIQGDETGNAMKGGEGSDVLYGNAGDDTLDGDSLASTSSADHLYGGAGQDTLKVDALDLTQGTVDGGTGFDTVKINAASGSDTAIDMHASNVEKVWGADSNDTIDGSRYTDTSGGYNKITGEYETTEAQRLDLYGRGGDDILKGGVGRDYIDGGEGDDIISGGAGRDFLYGAAGNDIFVLADDNEQYDNLYDFKSNADQHDILDISAFVTNDVDTANLQNYFSIGGDFIYFDKSGSGNFSSTNNIIAKLGGKADLTDPVDLKFGENLASFNASTGEFERSGFFENNAPVADTINFSGTEDQSLTFTKQQLLQGSSDAEGDALSIANVNYTGSDGSLTAIDSIIFDGNTNNNIALEPTLQSFDEFSVSLTYNSVGEHTGGIDALVSIATENPDIDNALLIQVNNADGSLGVFIAGGNYAKFDGIKMNDGQVHNINLTWDSETGTLKLFDNQQLIETNTIAQGAVLAADGQLILGQEQDSYGGGFDASQSLTNAAITQVTMAYEAVADETIVNGTNLADSGANLAFNVITENGNIVETVTNTNISVTDGIVVDTGHYEFTPNENFNGNIDINYDIADGYDVTSTQANLTFNAVNDVPEAVDDTITANEDDIAIEGQLTATDEDANEVLTYAIENPPTEGTVIINADGSYSFQLGDDFQDLKTGETREVTFSYRVTDAQGDSSVGTYTVTVDGVDDAAVITGDINASIAEDSATTLTTTGVLAVTDEDAGEASFTAATVAGTYGSIVIDATGNWTYTADNSQTAIQQLGDGDKLTETITVATVDGSTENIIIEILGTNDAPVISSTPVIQGTEDTTVVITQEQLLENATDIEGDDLSLTNVNYTGNDGTLVEINKITFGEDGNNQIEVTDKLQSMDAFSLNINYQSIGDHTEFQSIFSTSTPATDNGILLAINNSNIFVSVNNKNVHFSGVDLNDGASHNLTLTWDSLTGNLKLYDNNQLVDIKTVAQGTTIVADGWVIAGQEQDTYGGGLDPNQALTNAELDNITLAYDLVDQATIEAGTSVSDASSNLALDLRAENGQIVDKANGYNVSTDGDITSNVVEHYKFTPNANFNGNVTLDYDVSDGTDTTATSATLSLDAVNDAPEAVKDLVLQGTENTWIAITEEQLLTNATDIEGDNISLTNISYSGNDGILSDIHTINFTDNTDNNISFDTSLQSFDQFSVDITYKSVGEHSGDIDSILSLATTGADMDNSLLIYTNNSDGSLTVNIGYDNTVTFNGINMHDGQVHNIQLTWDSTTGELKLFDNHSLIATETVAQGVEIVAGGQLVLGQDQDIQGGGFQSSQSLTNAELGRITLAYEAISQTNIEAGVSISNATNNLAIDLVAENGQLVNQADDTTFTTAGGVTVGAVDHYEFTPNTDFNGNIVIDYDISDGTAITSTQLTAEIRENIQGTDTADTLTGTAENDLLEGLTANDSLDGGSGDDILIGGTGNDILTGGDGSDQFVFHASGVGTAEAPAEDVITDFHTGENGDVLDLADILGTEDSQLEEYLHLNFADGNTTIEVSQQANGDIVQKITLEGVDLSGYGGATTNSEIINNLLNDGNLSIDGQ